MFGVFEITIGGCFLLFLKQFFISYFNAKDNITESQRLLDIISSKKEAIQKKTTHFNNRIIMKSYSTPGLIYFDSSKLPIQTTGFNFNKKMRQKDEEVIIYKQEIIRPLYQVNIFFFISSCSIMITVYKSIMQSLNSSSVKKLSFQKRTSELNVYLSRSSPLIFFYSEYSR